MVKVDWKKDYRGEFACIHCGHLGLKLFGSLNGKRCLKCDNCGQKITVSYNLKESYLSSRLAGYGLACPSPDCKARQVVLYGTTQYGKKFFQCAVCGATAAESTDLTQQNLNRYGQKSLPVQPVNDEEDIWDLRSINASIKDKRGRYLISFEEITVLFLKEPIKKFIQSLCKSNKPFSTIDQHLTSFRDFSNYIASHNIQNISQINRSLILDFIATGNKNEVKEQRFINILYPLPERLLGSYKNKKLT